MYNAYVTESFVKSILADQPKYELVISGEGFEPRVLDQGTLEQMSAYYNRRIEQAKRDECTLVIRRIETE